MDILTLATIPLSQGYTALIDAEDFELVAKYRWRVVTDRDGNLYAVAESKLFMHRLLVDAKPGVLVDHRDGFGLHNWKSNLRLSTNRQNCCNQRPHRDKTSSRFKGVYQLRNGKFRSQIMHMGVKINLGSFSTEEEAARTYDANALKLHGEFARINFPEASA